MDDFWTAVQGLGLGHGKGGRQIQLKCDYHNVFQVNVTRVPHSSPSLGSTQAVTVTRSSKLPSLPMDTGTGITQVLTDTSGTLQNCHSG